MGCSNSVQVEALTVQNNSTIDKDKVKSLMSKAIDSKITSLDNLCKYFQVNTTNFTEEEKAFLAYRWMGLNVKYSAEVILRARGSDSKEAATNSAHASIFRQIAAELGIETVIVKGWIKDAKFDPEEPSTAVIHEWNTIKLRDRWQLIDSAWGTNGVLDDLNFCSDPSNFIRTHYPEDSQWQLLEKHVTREEFDELIIYSSYFYKYGLVSSNPNKAILTTKGQDKYLIRSGKGIDVKLMGKLNYLMDDKSVEINNGIFVQKMTDYFEVDVAFNRKGKYKVEFYAGKANIKNLKYVFEYIVNCTEDAPEAILFPTPFSGYEDTSAILLEPKVGPLKRGDKVKFKIQMQNAEGAAVVIGEEWTPLMKTKDIFEGEVIINNGEIGLFYKKVARKNYIRVLKFEAK